MIPFPSGSVASALSSTASRSPTLSVGAETNSGASSSALIVTATVSVDSFTPSDTVSLNSTVVFATPSGASKVGFAVSAPLSTTGGPETCSHE